ncbi:MAG: radical SAM protein [Anaerolineae bacterium]
MIYPGYLRQGFEPFDPIELAQLTEAKISRGSSRKYTDFYCVGVYGGISTGYTVGCCLRCIFCWVDFSRDFPDKYGDFYSPEEVAHRLMANARRKRVSKLRISGGEPMLCREHLLSVLDLLEGQGFSFILETNGIPLGDDDSYAQELARYGDVYVRVSLKAGTAEGFQERTGAKGEFWEFPFQAIESMIRAGVNFHVAAMTDARLMPPEERRGLLRKLGQIGYEGHLEEEMCDPYRTSLVRLQAAGWEIF